MKDLTKEQIKNITRDSNKELLDEMYIDDEARMARINQSDTYAYSITQAADLLHSMTNNVAMDYEAGNLSDSALEELIVGQCERLYAIAATVENTLRAIKAGTYKQPGSGNIIYPIHFKD
jgi:uncharacterized protein (DUF885 family)